MSVRDKYFCVYVQGRKEERNQGKKAVDKPCGLPYTDTDFCRYVRYTDFRANVKGRKEGGKEGRKEGDNPCGLSIIDRFLCIHQY